MNIKFNHNKINGTFWLEITKYAILTAQNGFMMQWEYYLFIVNSNEYCTISDKNYIRRGNIVS